MTATDMQRDVAKAQGFIFDIDGTLALGDKALSGYQLLPAAVNTLSRLQQRRIPYVVLTNGSTKTPQQLAQALQAAGLPIVPAHTLTPVSIALHLFLRKKYKRLLVLGGAGVWQPLAEAGFDIVLSPQRADTVDAVLVGWHPKVGLADLEAASHAIWAGADFYTVSTAAFVASRAGRTLGISGAIAAALQHVTGKCASVVGKPSRTAFKVACSLLNVQAQDVAVVGDDPSLENAMAHKCGAISVGVHTGLAQAVDFARLPTQLRPHYSLAGLPELLALLP